MTAEATAAGALERAIGLLDAPAAELAARRGLNQAGYLDLLEGELESTGPTQDLMVTRLVPAIYERYWRPALGRVAKGVTGPGMAEEMRIARLLLGLGEGDTVLDVACGPGNFTREFARAVGGGGLALGIDGSRTMLERGGEELRRADPGNLVLIRGDANALPFRDAKRRRLLLLRRPASVLGPVSGARRDAPGAPARRADRAHDLGPPRAHAEAAEAGARTRERDADLRGRRDLRGALRARLHADTPAALGPGSVRGRPPRRRLSALIGKTRTVTSPAAMKPAEVAASITPSD